MIYDHVALGADTSPCLYSRPAKIWAVHSNGSFALEGNPTYSCKTTKHNSAKKGDRQFECAPESSGPKR